MGTVKKEIFMVFIVARGMIEGGGRGVTGEGGGKGKGAGAGGGELIDQFCWIFLNHL